MNREDILHAIVNYVKESPLNYITADQALIPDDIGMRMYDDPIIAIGSADDPLWEGLKDRKAVGPIFKTPKEWLLKTNRKLGVNVHGLIMDPSIPEVLQEIEKYMKRFSDWGYEVVKHDFSSYDLLGRYGYRCGINLTESGWHFKDRSKTMAEIVLDLYHAIKRGAPDMLIIGCNTFSHLAAGIFEMQRIGDDTSGHQWERTRKMGVNTLAFRMPQHNTFYAVDADCVGLTNDVPWNLNRQWLDVLGNSGTVVLVSADPRAMGEDQKKAVSDAFRAASKDHPVSRPLDWLYTASPSVWKQSDGVIITYDWADRSKLESMDGETFEEI